MQNRTNQNEVKRAHMNTILTKLTDKGWTAAQLAAMTGVEAATVRAWKRGKSMGTNAQRFQLVELEGCTPFGEAVAVEARIKELDVVIDEETKKASAAGILPEAQPYSSLRMVRAQSWRTTLAERLK